MMAYIDNEGVMRDDGCLKDLRRTKHGDSGPVPELMMLKSDHQQAIAEKDTRIAGFVSELAAANERIRELESAVAVEWPVTEDANQLLNRAAEGKPLSLSEQHEIFEWLEERGRVIAEQEEQIENLRCDLSDEQGANGCLEGLNRYLSAEIEQLRLENAGFRQQLNRDSRRVDELMELSQRLNTALKAEIGLLKMGFKPGDKHE